MEIGKKFNIEYQKSTTLTEAELKLDTARKARKKAKEDAPEWFNKHQYEVVIAKSKDTGKSVETIVAEKNYTINSAGRGERQDQFATKTSGRQLPKL